MFRTISVKVLLATGFLMAMAHCSAAEPADRGARSDEKGVDVNSIGMKLKLIPAGEFLMGSPESDEDADGDERPQHSVRITKPFYLGVTEVTQGQWEAVTGSTLSDLKDDDWDYRGRGSENPMYWVSWYDAVDFCNKLSKREGRRPYYKLENVEPETYGSRPGIESADVTILSGDGYRLPTEAEWEYACRAGATTEYYWGDSDAEVEMKQYCWYEKNADDGSWTEPHASSEGTQPVQQKRANAFGLYDMSGNVWEWCGDWYDSDYYEDSPTDDPTGPTTGSAGRMGRGGGWFYDAGSCRSAYRGHYSPGDRSSSSGFRVASVPE